MGHDLGHLDLSDLDTDLDTDLGTGVDNRPVTGLGLSRPATAKGR